MPAINFKAEFAALVESGEKRQTIRKERKKPISIGDHLYLYSGLRGPNCKKLLDAVCEGIGSFAILENGNFWFNGRAIAANDGFAYRDGFRPYEGAADKMVEFFRTQYGLPFYGVLIRW